MKFLMPNVAQRRKVSFQAQEIVALHIHPIPRSTVTGDLLSSSHVGTVKIVSCATIADTGSAMTISQFGSKALPSLLRCGYLFFQLRRALVDNLELVKVRI